ncbi:MAG: NAD-dependent epimerase/dehydratase family protein [Bacteroidales bacterium]|nr:NAD-dependent epimerase/dehydratase family protein [Bacteroidales bacterium]
MKILVTGTAGFIGYHLAKKLLERGDTVVGIDNINDYYDVNLKYGRLEETGISREAEEWHKPVKSTKYPRYTFVRMNLEDREQMFKVFEEHQFDRVCHLAAQAGVRYSIENPYAYIDSNIVGFINILEACRHHKVEHLAYASSSSVYGNNTKMPLSTSDSVDHPISLYAATKKSNELMAHTYSHLYGIPTTGLRFFTVVTARGAEPDMALFLFTKAIIENKPIKVFNHGDMIRDFTFVDDIAEGVIRVIDNPPVKKEEGIGETENSVTPSFQERSELKDDGETNPDEERIGREKGIGNDPQPTTDNRQPTTDNLYPDPSVSETAPYKVYRHRQLLARAVDGLYQSHSKDTSAKKPKRNSCPCSPATCPNRHRRHPTSSATSTTKPDTPVDEEYDGLWSGIAGTMEQG